MKLRLATITLLLSGWGLSLMIFPAKAASSEGERIPPLAELTVQAGNTLALFSQGTATWLWLDVYDAKLFVSQTLQQRLLQKPSPAQQVANLLLNENTPIKLQLCYQQKISAEQIIEAAMEGLPAEMDNNLQTAVDALHKSYQEVKPGDCYALEHTSVGETILSFNNKEVFRTTQKGFKSIYFGIWIGELALSKSLKTSLLRGQS